MPKRKLESPDESLEALVDGYLSECEKEGVHVRRSTPHSQDAPFSSIKSEDSSQGNDAMDEELKTIVEVVEANSHLIEVIQRLLELKFFVP